MRNAFRGQRLVELWRCGQRALPLCAGVALWVAVAGLAACEGRGTPDPVPEAQRASGTAVTSTHPPAGSLKTAPWVEAPCEPGHLAPDVLACVGGAPISRAWLDAARKDADPEVSVRQLLDALIDEEVLAQAAAAKGLWRSEVVGLVQRQTMAGRLLDAAMVQITPDKIADSDIQRAYRFPAIITRYDHADAWFVVDAQILCCTGSAQQCAKRDEVRQCIVQSEAEARSIFAKITESPPKTGLEAWGRLKAMAAADPLLGVAEVHFYYDKTKTYEEQKGYDLMVKEFAEAVIQLEPGQWHAPVRSDFGWHISFLERVEPAVHLPWNDPKVREEIATNALTPVREREAQRFVFELLKQHQVQYFYERLDPQGPPAEGAAEL